MTLKSILFHANSKLHLIRFDDDVQYIEYNENVVIWI